jgi:hypothetical protein
LPLAGINHYGENGSVMAAQPKQKPNNQNTTKMKHDKPFKPFNGELLDEEGYPTEEFFSWLKNMPLDKWQTQAEI